MSGIGAPGFAFDTMYNYFALSFWKYGEGPVDMAKFWNETEEYFTTKSQFGESK